MTLVIPPVTVRTAVTLSSSRFSKRSATCDPTKDSIAPGSNRALYICPPSWTTIKFLVSPQNPATRSWSCSASLSSLFSLSLSLLPFLLSRCLSVSLPSLFPPQPLAVALPPTTRYSAVLEGRALIPIPATNRRPTTSLPLPATLALLLPVHHMVWLFI